MLINSTQTALKQIVSILETIQTLNTIKKDFLYIECNLGKHVRHICDHFLALKHGINTQLIDYNNRNRGTQIETDIDAASRQVMDLLSWLETYHSQMTNLEMNQDIQVFSEIDYLQTKNMNFKSNLAREFLYLINHTIHHAAHISLIANHHNVKIPLNTGMAPCTMTFLRSQNS